MSRSVFVATLLSLALLAASRARAQEEAGGVEGSSAEVGRNGAPGDARDEAAGGDDTGASDGGEPDGEEAGAGAADGASGGDADRASSEGEDADPAYGASTAEASSEGEDAARDYGATAQVYASSPGEAEESLGRSSVTRALMDVRQPRSAPDALRYEPGVAVQQTAHAQASPYVRGMTGQQVVHLFDGVRMNNGIYRQGPNQYFFTIDQRTLARLDVVRGATSVRFGSDALGGAILATPLRPFLDPDADGVVARPRLELRYGSADRELGGRAALELRLGPDT
ncbi:MAG TPA: TonB-dependent receptor plug domain-containing protein, partial [Polyangiaceae bacterium LLY-WYZ-15_(1-7)]|nr:TonB-dependent receptor plug domain-containing protein [Polyangiaceae bacterium LLY-WYZ-15_(1-7)]